MLNAPPVFANTASWQFTMDGDYTYDSGKVEITEGVIKLIAKDQTDDDNSNPGGFDEGTHDETRWDTLNECVELTATGQTNGSGDFTSRTIDAGGSVSWHTISWIPRQPFYKELPNDKGVETGYSEGNLDMTGNVLLMHMNEESGVVVDYSGEGNDGIVYGGVGYGASGRFNTALSFDGIDDYLDCGNDVSLNITDAISIETWMNPFSSAWRRKKPITISGSTSNLTEHQVMLIVDYDTDMQSDYDDIRFLDENGESLDYWIEDSTPSNAIVWVKVPSIPTSGTTIYMYYGNPSASSESDGNTTFEFFDDFDGVILDESKWTASAPSYVTVDNGSVRINRGTIYSDSIVGSTPQNYTFEAKLKYHTQSQSYSGFCIADDLITSGSNSGRDAINYII